MGARSFGLNIACLRSPAKTKSLYHLKSQRREYCSSRWDFSLFISVGPHISLQKKLLGCSHFIDEETETGEG